MAESEAESLNSFTLLGKRKPDADKNDDDNLQSHDKVERKEENLQEEELGTYSTRQKKSRSTVK
jgi:hypothetical protein